MDIQNLPTPDSPNHDAFEAVVELYYQTKGYITSSGKWFWVREPGKKLRGYQDIDVLAINKDEVLIVSVTSNLDDKLRFGRNGKIRDDMFVRLTTYFHRVHKYLSGTPEYSWIVDGNKPVKYVVAYHGFHGKTLAGVVGALKNKKIYALSSKVMFDHISNYSKQPNLKIQNQMLRVIQLLNSTKI